MDHGTVVGMPPLTVAAVLLAAMATAAVGGVYLGFSAMVMPALHGRRDAAAVMNLINVRAPRSAFMIAFLASPIACLVSGFLVLAELPGVGGILALAGAAAGVVGFAITAAVNVPLNNQLATAGADDAAFAAFEGRWRRANAVRAAVSFVGAALLAAGLVG